MSWIYHAFKTNLITIWAISIFHSFHSICLLTVTWHNVMYTVILGGEMSHWNYSSFDANQFVIEANAIKYSKHRNRMRQLLLWLNNEHLRNAWIGWTTNAATCQIQFLIFGGGGNGAGGDHWRLWRCQNRYIIILLMDIGSSSNRFDTTLKASIVAIVRCILNAQIINALVRSEIHSVVEKWERKRSLEYRAIMYQDIKLQYLSRKWA